MPPLQSSQQQPDIVSSSLITSQQQQQQPATLDQNLERLFSFSIIETKDDYEEVSRSKVIFDFNYYFFSLFKIENVSQL